MNVRLAMIVRDCAAVLERCLVAARPLISSWTIIDTGSSDGTPRLVREVLAGIPGRLYRSEWRDFAHNRTELMRRAGGADYLLLLDADTELRQRGPLPELTADIGMVRVVSRNLEYLLPVLVRSGKGWEYRGAAHSYLAALDGQATEQVVEELLVVDHGSTSEEKIRRDVALLSGELVEKPGDPRATFYLARSYDDLGLVDAAIATYGARATLGGFEEERFYSLYRAGVLLVEHRNFAEGAVLLLEAWRMRPHRAEPLRALSNSARSVADKIPYPAGDLLFVHRDLYANDEETKRFAEYCVRRCSQEAEAA
jgi:Glycosyl transferase family 2